MVVLPEAVGPVTRIKPPGVCNMAIVLGSTCMRQSQPVEPLQNAVPLQQADGKILAVQRGDRVDAKVDLVAVGSLAEAAPFAGAAAIVERNVGQHLEVRKPAAAVVAADVREPPDDAQMAARRYRLRFRWWPETSRSRPFAKLDRSWRPPPLQHPRPLPAQTRRALRCSCGYLVELGVCFFGVLRPGAARGRASARQALASPGD